MPKPEVWEMYPSIASGGESAPNLEDDNTVRVEVAALKDLQEKLVASGELDPEEADASSKFHRVIVDRELRFGDGGTSDASYPVFVCPELRLNAGSTWSNKHVLKVITSEFSRLAAQRNDVQQNGVVEDIVDPELYGQYIRTGRFQTHFSSLRSGVAERPALAFSKQRGSYTWIPSIVKYNTVTKKALYTSPIQNLPRTPSNERLYKMLELTLSHFMGPFIRECGAQKRKDGGPCNTGASGREEGKYAENNFEFYNVCTKIQRYKIPDGASYKGQWHTEGVNEAVTAVGVLYTDMTDSLAGGALKFRPVSNPDGFYRRSCSDSDTREDVDPILNLVVETDKGTAIAFKNELPHRFCRLVNMNGKGETATRSFVNFFVTRPDLPTTAEIPTNADIYLALVGKINFDCIGEILSYLHYTPLSHTEALELRAGAKAEMVATKGKWGSINYGNCGMLEYLSCGGPSHVEKEAKNGPYFAHQGTAGSIEGLNLKEFAPGMDRWSDLRVTSHPDSYSDREVKSLQEL